MIWCSHLEWKFSSKQQKEVWFFTASDNLSAAIVTADWTQCPICGAPRPEEKKESFVNGLANKLAALDDQEWYYRKLAQIAINYLLESIDEAELERELMYAKPSTIQVPKALKKYLRRKWLG